jgi:uncharacterized SAM-binding protein YcdF (DUF218 family)
MPLAPPIADVIVVLGCRIGASGRLSPAGARRAREAASAFHRGLAPRVITSGGRRWGHLAEAQVLREELVRAGVPADRITAELCSLTTWENAQYTASLLGLAPSKSLGGAAQRCVALVTCSWHMPRAVLNFRAAGLDSIPVPAEPGPTPMVRVLSRRIHETVSELIDARLRRATGGGWV